MAFLSSQLPHSLEIELPFVYELFGDKVKVVMMMVGCVNTKQKEMYAECVHTPSLTP